MPSRKWSLQERKRASADFCPPWPLVDSGEGRRIMMLCGSGPTNGNLRLTAQERDVSWSSLHDRVLTSLRWKGKRAGKSTSPRIPIEIDREDVASSTSQKIL